MHTKKPVYIIGCVWCQMQAQPLQATALVCLMVLHLLC